MIRSNLYKFVAKMSLGTNNITREVFPVFTKFSINKKDDDYATVIGFDGALTFVNKASENINDYDLIKECEAYDIGTRINIDVYIDNVYTASGYFYPYQANYNDDTCTVSSNLMTDDAYHCIKRYIDTKENILSEVDAFGEYRIPTPITFMTWECEGVFEIDLINNAPSGCPVYWDEEGLLFGSIGPFVHGLPRNIATYYSPLPITTYYCPNHVLAQACLANSFIDPFSLTTLGYNRIDVLRVVRSEYEFVSWTGNSYVMPISGDVYFTANVRVKTTWGAETVVTVNDPVTGAQVTPAGGGWIDYNTYTQGGIIVTRWVRIAYYNNQTYKYHKSVDECNNKVYELIDPYIDDPSNTYYIYRSRALKDTIEMFLEKADCGLTYESEFFNSDTNPLTGTKNFLQYLQLNNCSDLKDPDSTEAATILEMSLGTLLENLTNLFNCYWYIDGDKFRIEHRKFFENGYSYGNTLLGVNDLRAIENRFTGESELVNSNNYRYNSENIINKERWEFSNYFYYDFSPYTVSYNIEGSENEKTLTEQFYTDIQAVYNFPDEYSNNNVVLVAIQWQLINPSIGQWAYVIVNETGLRSGDMATNGHLCWSNLIPLYWTYGRVFTTGEVEGDPISFDSTLSKKLQSVEVTDCDDSIDVPGLAKTNLGTGRIISSSWDIIKKTKKLEIEI